MRAALYARYSSDRQNERSNADQLEVCRRHAFARGWTTSPDLEFQDAAISGAAMANRPGLQALLAAAAAEPRAFDLVLVEDEDRLARNQEHLAHVANRLEDLGVVLATLTTDRVEDLHVAFKGLIGAQYIKVLSAKTRRGMRANAEAGKATGARLYGYRSQPGGALAVVEAEAEVIRRICAEFAAGASGREIAARLNRDAVPGPRRGMWNASTVLGSRARGNGVVRTELYAGVKVWNRLEVKRDRQTGRRIPALRPREEWRRTPVPHLRIVDAATWSAVQARLASFEGTRPEQHRRRPGLFSGLLKCGCCGASYTAYSRTRLLCAAHRERGDAACRNSRTLVRADVEGRVLAALQSRLLPPEAVALYVRTYHEAFMEERAREAAQRAPLDRRLAELDRRIARAVEAILDGTASQALKDSLAALEPERDALRARLAELDAAPPPPMELHPNAPAAYARIVANLADRLAEAAALGDSPAEREQVDAVRALITEIRIIPEGHTKAAPVRLALSGPLALFLTPVAAAAVEQTHTLRCGSALVAGGGIEPPTCGL